jgi:serine/threonine-protein kinase
MPESLRDRAAAALGHQYAIEDEIGIGGMSVVYRARDLRLNRTVAIKVLPPELAHDSAVRNRFTREAQTSAQLSHPHIVPIYDVGERNGVAYFVMALIGGGSVASLIERNAMRPIDEVRRLLTEIADALAYAHANGVIHRDIKADNILLESEGGRALVTDFGIARAIESGTRLTATGIAVGTPTYMSPEQAVGDRDIDGRSDIYSLGVLGYQMLTGRVPFTAGNPMALLLKHVSETPRPIAELRPEAPRALASAIERALQKTPHDRWQTAAALRDALRDPWRSDQPMVRYASPVPRSASPQARTPSSSREPAPIEAASPPTVDGPTPIVMEAPHLAKLTPEQRADLRLWHGRVNLFDRIKAMRGYGWLSGALLLASIGGLAGVPEVPPLILGPLIPVYMTVKTWKRAKSLRASGLRVRRVMFMPRAKWVLPRPATPPSDKKLEKLAPRAVLDSPRGAAIRRAVEERAAIMSIFSTLSKADRALLPDVEPTVNALVERVAHLARALHALDGDIDPSLIGQLDARIAAAEQGRARDDDRQINLLRRQRATADELVQRRVALARQIESAGLALGNLRLDLIKFRSSGLESARGDVSTATQEARALSRDIGLALDAAAEVRDYL